MEKILIVEDDIAFGTMIQTWLRKKGFDVEKVGSVKAAIATCEKCGDGEGDYQLVLSDLRLPDHDGIFLLKWLRKTERQVPFIVMTSYAEIQNVVTAMKAGATDYVAKPFHPDVLLEKIHEAMKGQAAAEVNKAEAEGKEGKSQAVQPAPSDKQDVPKCIEGESEASRKLYGLVALVAPTPMSVLILGASGTGKEHVARRIHELSPRAEKNFFAIDCGAVPREVAASEFFGHKKGAFTGADQDKKGAFEMANGGTLFLDEVGNLSYEVQVQLLRALQERKIRPLGGSKEIDIDIRLVCATNEDLAQQVEEGNFREDLYHRINEFTIFMPALKDRGNDLFLFADLFIRQANKELGRHVEGLDEKAREMIVSYPWPGNLREMNNVMKRATLLAKGKRIGTAELELSMNRSNQGQNREEQPRSLSALYDEQTEQDRIAAALEAAGGNKSKAAQLLGIDRKTIYNKLKKYSKKLGHSNK